jgi:hypothetical protein
MVYAILSTRERNPGWIGSACIAVIRMVCVGRGAHLNSVGDELEKFARCLVPDWAPMFENISGMSA